MPAKGRAFRGIRLRLPGGHIAKFSMPLTLASGLTGGDEDRLRHPFNVVEMRVLEDGFLFVFATGEASQASYFRYTPADFRRFIAEIIRMGVSQDALLIADTTAAVTVIRMFDNWCTLQCADDFERDIHAGELTFEEVRDIRAAVFDVPSFMRFHAARFKADDMPRRAPGKRAVFDPRVLDLYGLACRIYRNTPGLSYEAACDFATEKRPDLVPKTWQADPGGNLKRRSNVFDKSAYSQLSYRKSRMDILE